MLEKILSQIYIRLWGVSCEKYTELASKRIDSKLARKEGFQYKWHNCFCLFCRRFNRQINTVDSACSCAPKTKPPHSLDPQKKEQLQQALSQEFQK